MNEHQVRWPPQWPLSSVPQSPDEADIGRLVKQLGLDERGYDGLVAEARELFASRRFQRLAVAIGYGLEQHGTLDRRALSRLKAISEGAEVEHLTLKAATTAVSTDAGTFEAVISTQSPDREQDVVDAAAMVTALRAWIDVGKKVPLAWEHSTAPDDIVGHIDPATVRAVDGEVIASGWIDQDTDRGRQAWRLVKSGALGFSFGYLVPAGGSTPRAGGGRRITALDVFEVSGTMAPMNNGTRVLGWKSMQGDPEYDRVRRETRDLMLSVLGASTAPAESLREKSLRFARECAPIQTATFDC